MDAKQLIIENKTALGIELGSTRIKAVLIDENFSPVASGGHNWENRLEDGIWTYRLDDVWAGVQDCFRNLSEDVKKRYCLRLSSFGAIGISAMMHGYLVFDKNGNQLVPFRTWRNTMTEKAAFSLTEEFQFNIPQRWNIAHLYQAVLNGEPHVKDIDFMTTLAGFVHWRLTGKKILGIGDASGVFPVDSGTNNYNARMLNQFDKLVSSKNFNWQITDILPSVLSAGENAGTLTPEGAKLLDPAGILKAGIPFCPPEGDAGTGMVATNSIAERTGNVSAGTSVFAMIVTEKELSRVYPEIDMVATPAGKPVAMVHCNNCTTDFDAWVKLFAEALDLTGAKIEKPALYDALYNKALEGEEDCGGLFSCNYYSGETLTNIEEGRPLFARLPDSNFTLANFMKTLLFSSLGTLKLGMDILVEKEKVKIDTILGHGGLFKTKGVGQRFMAAALNTPVSVMEESAAEGGAWGIALLAAFMLQGKENLEKFLAQKVFAAKTGVRVNPDQRDIQSFKIFMSRYVEGLKVERAAVENLKRGKS
ncbi:MAG: FGGY-family carbohydrate kinase [Treponema sp.]|jgi:sugar (pentulose or hexulose) kinase|nr:FGGY-family carbohydrate kinase [Treponema sp.]